MNTYPIEILHKLRREGGLIPLRDLDLSRNNETKEGRLEGKGSKKHVFCCFHSRTQKLRGMSHGIDPAFIGHVDATFAASFDIASILGRVRKPQ